MEPIRCTYLLPFWRAQFSPSVSNELAVYFRLLGHAGCEVLVVDGSPPAVFARNREAWAGLCDHVQVDRTFGCMNDKVNGIHTGVRLSRHEKIILADDDIRYTPESLSQVMQLLDRFEVVRPQNFLDPLPWWARLEAARMLINRATLRTGDYPGTCAFRRQSMLSAGPYDGDVLFDNEEIIRHFAQAGAHIRYAVDLFVRKVPPSFRKWIEQRPRQAYEDFGLRAKTAFFFAVLPVLLGCIFFSGTKGALLCLGGLSLLSMAVALRGWFRGSAPKHFPLSITLFAPLWVCERGVSTYWASYWFLVHGGYPFGGRLLFKGIGRDWRTGERATQRVGERAA
jgi:Glycosyltransferase like family 2